jgi:hypothetical protein
MYNRGSTAIAHGAMVPPNHPFMRMVWSRSCNAGQLTSGMLLQAQAGASAPFPVCPTTAAHGKQALWTLYHDHLKFLNMVDLAEI